MSFPVKVLVFILSFLKLIVSFENDLTPEISAGTQQCFFQPIKKVATMEVEYQVKNVIA